MIGATGETARVVTSELTARAVGSGDVEVFATPMLIALLEAAACAAIRDDLPDDVTSVGTHVDVRHRAASPIGVTVTAVATVTEEDGNRIAFDLTAWHDANGERVVVATGRHARAIVDRATFGT